MHCNEAERRLSRTEAVGGSPVDDAELLAHLDTCPSCARQADASALLGRAFADLRSEGTDAMPAWAKVRTDIERGANPAHHQPGRIAIVMEKLFNPLTGRTRRRVVFAAAVAVLAFVTLIPFHYQKTVGYEVAFAGVNKDLAMDQGKLELLLSKLGMGDAVVDLGNCEATCSLVVSNLKSPDDCQVLVFAMKELGDVQVVSGGNAVCEPASGSLVKLAGERVFVMKRVADPADVEAHVVQCLGEDFPEGMNVWVSKCDSTMSVKVELADGFAMPGCAGDSTKVCSLMIAMADSACPAGAEGMRCIVIGNPDGTASGGSGLDPLQSLGIDFASLKEGIDDETRAKLEALGFEVQVVEEDGKRAVKVIKRDGADGAASWTVDDSEAGDAATKEAVVPEGYALDQNYPNPFNPSTAISFVLPRSERVKLEVVNVLGQRVRTLVDETMSAGPHEVQWDATDDNGQRVPSGTYLYRISAGDFSSSRTMTLLK